jgi:C-terminal processing protease CtpA/Prc
MRSLAALLALALFLQASDDSRPSPSQLKAVLEAINKAVETEYCDPQVAPSWLQSERQHENRILRAKSKQEAVDEIRRALAELHNSHVFFYTRDEWKLRQNVLPLTFEKREGRVFVRTPLRHSDLRFGDEIAEINGQPASALQPKSLAKASGVYGNPLYGEPSSMATLTVVSDGGMRKVQVQRIKLGDEDAIQAEELTSHAIFIRLLSLPGDETGTSHLQESWNKATSATALVIDLRDCSGGWPSASSYILDSLLGSSRKPFKSLDRRGAEVPLPKALAPSPRFTGPVAVLIGEGTQSECEVLAAGLRETRRAILVGDKTAGAFNGFTTSVSLPDDFAFFALPYTRTLSPQNVTYEGIGVAPDKAIENGIDNFRAGHDRVLEEAEPLIGEARSGSEETPLRKPADSKDKERLGATDLNKDAHAFGPGALLIFE